MTKNRRNAVLSTAAVALVATVMVACGSADDGAAPRDVSDMIPILAEDRQPRDTLPDATFASVVESKDLVPGSSRLLRESDLDRQWVALDSSDNICLMNELLSTEVDPAVDGGVVGSTCVSPAAFQRQGIRMSTGGADHQTVAAYLVPADVDLDAMTEAGIEQVEGGTSYAPQLFVVAPGGADAAEGVAVERGDGGSFVIERLR